MRDLNSEAEGKSWIVWGISELGGWLGHRNPTAGSPSGHDAEDCLDGHLACGIDHVVWDLGRSVLTYHSDLPGATCRGLRDLPETLTSADHRPGHRARAVEALYRRRCQLRAALRHAREKGIVLYGRLCMNRHYTPGSSHRGQFAHLHPQWCEVAKDGWLDVSRLCYAIPEVRQERIAILMEAADIGVDGLHLDFCRQPPMVRYHPAYVNAYRERTGVDSRTLTLAQREDFLRWCAYRAEAVTDLLRELKAEVEAFRARWQRPLPVQVRVPNDGFEANLIAGLDVVTWCQEGLIDELALSELHWLHEYQVWDDEPYIALGEQHAIPVYAAANCLPRQGGEWSGEVNPRGVNPLVLARRALRSHEAGASGIALYQSDTGVQWPGVRDAVAAMWNAVLLRTYVEDPDVAHRYPVTAENAHFGIDNHSAEFAQFHAAPGPAKGAV
jgi:hypothetical protein